MSKSDGTTAFSHNQLVQDFQETCAPRQRALLSLLAICEKHALPPSELVASLANDLPRTPLESRRRTRKFYWSRVKEFSRELGQARSEHEALEEFPGLLPGTVELALRCERENGTLDGLNDAWLSRPPDYIFDISRSDPFVARLFPLFVKFLFILWVAAFILIRVVPEFLDMMEEFGMETPPVFELTIDVFDRLAKFWFVPFVLALIALPFFFPAILRYLKTWNPFVWQQPIHPAPVSTRQALALVMVYGKTVFSKSRKGFRRLKRALKLNATEDAQFVENDLDWNQLAAQKIVSRNEAQALQMADTDETRAWLMRKSAKNQHELFEDRGRFFSRCVVTVVNIFLGFLVMLLALSVFSFLISIISQLR